MTQHTQHHLVWYRWLLVVSVGVMVFGIGMVLAPNLTRQLFGLLLYASADGLDGFGAGPLAYVTLVHGVLGAVMFGWSVALLYIVLGPFRRRSREGWQMLAVSVACWFVPDTAFSLWMGFWQNAVLNLGFVLLFILPLAATYRVFHQLRA